MQDNTSQLLHRICAVSLCLSHLIITYGVEVQGEKFKAGKSCLHLFWFVSGGQEHESHSIWGSTYQSQSSKSWSSTSGNPVVKEERQSTCPWCQPCSRGQRCLCV